MGKAKDCQAIRSAGNADLMLRALPPRIINGVEKCGPDTQPSDPVNCPLHDLAAFTVFPFRK